MKISVCIATYNGEKYIKEQLDSILKQLGENDEIIISDDSSFDKTVDLINEYNDKRIRVILNQVFKNAIFNFENALKYASGDLIFLSDQDDIWVEGRVKHMVKELKKFDMVVCDHCVINDRKEVLIDSYFKNIPSRPGIIKNLIKNTYYGCCMAFKKELLSKALPFPVDIPMHDIWLGFVADTHYKASFINVVYTMYRKHDKNVSIATELKSDNNIFTKLKYRINIIKYLPLLMSR